MKKTMTAVAAATLTGLLLNACGQNNNPVSNVREAAADPSLQGKSFQSNCSAKPIGAVLTGILTGGDAAIKSARTEYRFIGTNLTRKTLVYSTADCAGTPAATFTESGVFDIVKDQKTSDGATAVDMDFSKLEVNIQNDSGAQIAKAISLCGSTSWSTNQQVDVTTKSGDLNCYAARVPRRVANVYKLDGKTLYLGTASKDQVDVRPTAIDRSNLYIAQ